MLQSLKGQSGMQAFTLKFQDEALESAYNEAQLAHYPYLLQFGLGFLVLMFMTLAICQMLLTEASLLTNLAYATMGLVALVIFSLSNGLKAETQPLMITLSTGCLMIAGVLGIGLMPNIQPHVYTIAVLVTFTWFTLLTGVPYLLSLATIWSLLGVYTVLFVFFGGTIFGYAVMSLTVLLLTASVVTLLAFMNERRLRLVFLSDSTGALALTALPPELKPKDQVAKDSKGVPPTTSRPEADWAQALKAVTVELAGIHEFDFMCTKLLEHIKTAVPYEASAVGRLRNGKMLPVLFKASESVNDCDTSVKAMWNSKLVNNLRNSRCVQTGAAAVGLLDTTVEGDELSFGYRLDIPFFSQNELNGVVTLLRTRPAFNDFEVNMASSMVFHGMFARRTARIQLQLNRMTTRKPLTAEPAEAPAKRVAPKTEAVASVHPAIQSMDDFIYSAGKAFDQLKSQGSPVSLLLVELDKHDTLHEKYGRSRSKQILAAVGNILRDHLDKDSLIGHYGQGSYAIQLAKDIDQAKEFAERLRQQIQNQVLKMNGYKVQATVSIGLSAQSKTSMDFLSVVRCADMGLFLARDANGNTVRVN